MKKQGSFGSLLKPRIVHGLLSMSIKGYFVETGWLNSYLHKQSLATDGSPLPWLTYSFLDFIEGKVKDDFKIFEFGSGNSTLYFSRFTPHITSIEHDRGWYDDVRAKIPKHISLNYYPLTDNSYEESILQTKDLYDIILIDGRRRVICAKNAINKLTDAGVIVLDDSERAKYKDIFSIMEEAGFKHLPFSGIAIGAIHRKCTSIFYKANNVLDI